MLALPYNGIALQDCYLLKTCSTKQNSEKKIFLEQHKYELMMLYKFFRDYCDISYRSWASKHIGLASKHIELLTELEKPTELSEDTTLQQCVVTPSPSSHGPSHLQACSHYPHFVPLLMIIYHPIVRERCKKK